MKIGTVDCAIPATLESMCVSPHATRPIGSGGVDHAEDEARAPRGAQLGDRPGDRPMRHDEVREQQHACDEDTELGHRRGRNVVDGDLDEEVRRAPHRREQQRSSGQ